MKNNMAQLLEEKRKIGTQQTELYTIGYEGRDIEEFALDLKNFGIQVLVDVRDLPFSRKKGFSKTPLSQYLQEFDIEYIHLKSLGSPKDLRDKVRNDGDYEYFHKEYSAYIQSQKETIEELYEIVLNNNSCLMCYERNPYSCHRLDVAREIEKRDGNNLSIQHI
jgi:uncharacterized protein (DUF488 family)